MTTETEQLQEVFIGRQPVLDRQQATMGYELLFRPGPQNRADIDSPTRATADVVCSAFAELGLSAALTSQQAFINVGEDFLLDDAVELLPPQQVVLEIESVHDFSAPLLRRCRELGGKGYSFCLHWSGEAGEGLAPLLDMLSYAKIDANPAMPATFKALSTALRGSRVRMIAGRVETAEDWQYCARLGFDLFQGYYFARPVVIEGRKLDPSTQGLIAIINLLGGEDADLAAVEAAFKGEPALLANLLRLTNSVGVGGALSSRTVSYTHLDVYKREEPRRRHPRQRRQHQRRRRLGGRAPVSYTHLDVYKRAVLLESKEKNRGVAIHANGVSINAVVVSVDERYVVARSQQSSRIVIRLDRIDGVSAFF